jgi:hypothetical protein
MTKRTNDKKSLADPGAIHLELRFYPYANETQAVLVVARGLGDRAQRVRVWSGLLDATRADLRGLGSGECAVLLTDHLRRALTTAHGDRIPATTDTASEGGLGAPLGAIGGIVTQPELPLG